METQKADFTIPIDWWVANGVPIALKPSEQDVQAIRRNVRALKARLQQLSEEPVEKPFDVRQALETLDYEASGGEAENPEAWLARVKEAKATVDAWRKDLRKEWQETRNALVALQTDLSEMQNPPDLDGVIVCRHLYALRYYTHAERREAQLANLVDSDDAEDAGGGEEKRQKVDTESMLRELLAKTLLWVEVEGEKLPPPDMEGMNEAALDILAVRMLQQNRLTAGQGAFFRARGAGTGGDGRGRS